MVGGLSRTDIHDTCSCLSLSFDYKPLFADQDLSDPFNVGFGDNEESFSVSLLDGPGGNPLIQTDADSTILGEETYYFMHDWDYFMGDNKVVTDPTYVTLKDLGGGWTNVTLGLGDLLGVPTGAFLAFDLVPGWDDYGLNSQVEVDNVSVAVVPAFSSVTLGLLGLGTLGALRRRRRAGGK